MSTDEFQERIAGIRRRFVASLEGKIEDTYAVLPTLSAEGDAVVEAVAETYRRIHGICGIGPTVGFGETARAAKAAEAVLIEAYRGQRTLSADELARFESALHALRAAARRELPPAATAQPPQ